ncbi:uncharacterized protein LOC141713030 isoform X2 [Apium graveolens]|uniref:uncharacterized protein LOC141713030 isoform X2 n=1 Tax=Apium graveolens TaxID=4045 RepID=UPI003D7A075F
MVIIEADLFDLLLNLSQNVEFDVKKKAACAISNVTCRGSSFQISYLVDQNCIKPLCDLLDYPESRELEGHGKVFLCLALQVLRKHSWPKMLLQSVEWCFSMFLLLSLLRSGDERVSAWFGACLILQEHMHRAQCNKI